jgi:hypothetical protein
MRIDMCDQACRQSVDQLGGIEQMEWLDMIARPV